MDYRDDREALRLRITELEEELRDSKRALRRVRREKRRARAKADAERPLLVPEPVATVPMRPETRTNVLRVAAIVLVLLPLVIYAECR